LLALATVILSACRMPLAPPVGALSEQALPPEISGPPQGGVVPASAIMPGGMMPGGMTAGGTMPGQMTAGPTTPEMAMPPETCAVSTPLPYDPHLPFYDPNLPWAPPGIERPWPRDEYLRDGGDRGSRVLVKPDWTIEGLEQEDTIGHYDTLHGETFVVPSNRVCLYAPRFAAVRTVTHIAANAQFDASAGIHKPVQLIIDEETKGPATSYQAEQAWRDLGVKRLRTYRTNESDGVVSLAIGPMGFHNEYMLYENLSVIRTGQIEVADKPQLAKGLEAAITWTHDHALQVAIDHQSATESVGDRRAQATFVAEEIPGKPMLRICKVASTHFAQPGDMVDFTIRFDNVGTKPMGNVTIVDNLTTRLAYVPETAQSSLKANFLTEPNVGDSLVLRWEILDPLEPGEGGVVRFRCRVR
jgi:uncharacterized repeat protein (TIGR01451 family)